MKKKSILPNGNYIIFLTRTVPERFSLQILSNLANYQPKNGSRTHHLRKMALYATLLHFLVPAVTRPQPP